MVTHRELLTRVWETQANLLSVICHWLENEETPRVGPRPIMGMIGTWPICFCFICFVLFLFCFRFVLFRFIFVSFRFVSFRFASFCFVLFCFFFLLSFECIGKVPLYWHGHVSKVGLCHHEWPQWQSLKLHGPFFSKFSFTFHLKDHPPKM